MITRKPATLYVIDRTQADREDAATRAALARVGGLLLAAVLAGAILAVAL